MAASKLQLGGAVGNGNQPIAQIQPSGAKPIGQRTLTAFKPQQNNSAAGLPAGAQHQQSTIPIVQ